MMKIKLKKIAKVLSGSTAPKDNEFSENNGKPFIRAGHLEELCNGKSLMELPKIEESVAQNRKMVLVPENTILFAKSGMSILKNRVYKTTHEAYIVNHLAAIICSNEIEPDYLYYFFRANPPSRLVLDSSYPSIRLSDIGEIDIDLPSKAIQKKISKLLKQAEEIIFKRKAQIEALDQLTQSVFLEMFGDPVTNKTWERRLLKDIADVRDGTHDSPKYVPSGYPLVTSKNIKNGKIDLSNVNYISEEDFININKRSKVDIGDIIMPMIGTIGNPIIVDEQPNFAIKNVALIKFNNPLVVNIYLKYLLDSHYLDYILNKNKRGGTQKFLSLTDIRNMEIPLPPRDLQDKFSEIVKKVDSQKAILHKSLRELEKNFNSLMQRAFKGELFND